MKLFKKKIAPKWYQLQIIGKKTWELRVNDCDYQEGDMLLLKEWEDGQYTGREFLTVITNVATDLPYVQENVVILTTREATPKERTKMLEIMEKEEI